jgi:hypothetical protein
MGVSTQRIVAESVGPCPCPDDIPRIGCDITVPCPREPEIEARRLQLVDITAAPRAEADAHWSPTRRRTLLAMGLGYVGIPTLIAVDFILAIVIIPIGGPFAVLLLAVFTAVVFALTYMRMTARLRGKRPLMQPVIPQPRSGSVAESIAREAS